jgi:hypothetical protein
VDFGRDAWGTGQVFYTDVPALGTNDAFVEILRPLRMRGASPETAPPWVHALPLLLA